MTDSALEADITARTDTYFKRTRNIIEQFGDVEVTYAIFMRRPVIAALEPAVAWFEAAQLSRAMKCSIKQVYPDGDWVGAGEPLLYITGSFAALAELETLLLQKIGPTCVAAHNAYQMCLALPRAVFLAMDARHCAGAEMQMLMGFACALGGRAARREGAKGFVGSANDATAPFFGATQGMGTMPHALVGYAGSTLRAAEMFVETSPRQPLAILPDYFGLEITDTLAVCRRFPDMAADGRLSVRLDTHGGRYMESLDPQRSYGVLERHAPGAIRRFRSDSELRYLVGTGVSAAALWCMRDALDEAGFPAVRLVASSGFGVEKCRVLAEAFAPIDVVGTGSYLPETWSETYATADIVAYDRQPRVKIGREFLLK